MLRKCHFGTTVNVDEVVTIAEHACDHVLKRVLKLSAYRLQIFLVTDEYLRSLQLCEDQGIHGKPKKRVLAIVTTHMDTRLSKDAQDVCNS